MLSDVASIRSIARPRNVLACLVIGTVLFGCWLATPSYFAVDIPIDDRQWVYDCCWMQTTIKGEGVWGLRNVHRQTGWIPISHHLNSQGALLEHFHQWLMANGWERSHFAQWNCGAIPEGWLLDEDSPAIRCYHRKGEERFGDRVYVIVVPLSHNNSLDAHRLVIATSRPSLLCRISHRLSFD